MAITDDVARLVQIVTRDLVLSGRAKQLRLAADLSCSELAKAAGTTAAAVGLWETGRASPTTQQALAWLSHLYEAASWREAAGQEVAK